MRLWLTPEIFNALAITLAEYRWKLLLWSLGAFLLYAVLEYQVVKTTPTLLIWLIVLILFSALQALVLAAFIFFFQDLPSSKVQDKQWFKFYRVIEWCETLLFGFILPLPTLLFIYAFITI
ncbi:hypothetical protein tinsulaeT_02360 [Thalassotalea insulae]|uniref:Uncharacterized protein n=1 Tax=Thalassotalea insulae TaxID=2056778 RepID=A0ABQ6GRW3_9GAMM|nr:hypothetical protein [Thalassotalea insulae]GLX76896.1 hypothetical protein tinsulaeT_02360 [Thalassotalea insulae]